MTNLETLTAPNNLRDKNLFHDIVNEAILRAEDASRTTQTQRAVLETAEPRPVLSPTEEITKAHAVIDAALAKAQKRRTATMPAGEIPLFDDSPQAALVEEETAPVVPEAAPVSPFPEYAKGEGFHLTREEVRQKLSELKATK